MWFFKKTESMIPVKIHEDHIDHIFGSFINLINVVHVVLQKTRISGLRGS